MVKYVYPFSFNFDYDLLLQDALSLSKFQVLHKRTGTGNNYRKADKGEDITLQTFKLSLLKTPTVKDHPNCISIVNQCKKLLSKINSIEYDILLLEYDSDCFLGWHIDNPPEADYGRINIVLTENWKDTPIIFKDGVNEIECPAKLSVVNSYRYEHKYDNRGRDKRLLLCITTLDKNYEECINAITGL